MSSLGRPLALELVEGTGRRLGWHVHPERRPIEFGALLNRPFAPIVAFWPVRPWQTSRRSRLRRILGPRRLCQLTPRPVTDRPVPIVSKLTTAGKFGPNRRHLIRSNRMPL